MSNLQQKILNAQQRSERMLDVCRKAARPSSLGDIVAGRSSVGMWQQDRNAGAASEQYLHFSGHVYTAITAIAKRIAGQPIRVAYAKRGSGADLLEPLDQHQLLLVLADPNPLMTRCALIYSTVAGMLLTGRSFWMLSADRFGRRQIMPLPANWVRQADAMRTAWEVRPRGQIEPIIVPGDQMACFYLPDPADPWSSHSPLQSQARAVDVDESIQIAQNRAFANPNPGLVLKVGSMDLPGAGAAAASRPMLTPEQRQQIYQAVMGMYAGVQSYGLPFIVDALIEDVTRISDTPAEMDFLNSGKQTRSRIFTAYGVNPLITGEIEGANRAQAVTAGQQFAENTVNPLIMFISEAMTQWVGPWFDSQKLTIWIEPCQANDAELTQKNWDIAAKYGVVSIDELRKGLLGLAGIPGGEALIQPPKSAPESDGPGDLAKALDPEWNPYSLDALRD